MSAGYCAKDRKYKKMGIKSGKIKTTTRKKNGRQRKREKKKTSYLTYKPTIAASRKKRERKGKLGPRARMMKKQEVRDGKEYKRLLIRNTLDRTIRRTIISIKAKTVKKTTGT